MQDFSIELIKSKDGYHSLVYMNDMGCNKFVICEDYDGTKEFGHQWYRGQYFFDLLDAVECWLGQKY